MSWIQSVKILQLIASQSECEKLGQPSSYQIQAAAAAIMFIMNTIIFLIVNILVIFNSRGKDMNIIFMPLTFLDNLA